MTAGRPASCRAAVAAMRSCTRGGIAAGILWLAGCGGPHEASVSGTVTLDGQPLVGAHVTFQPASTGAAAYGRSLHDGSYEIFTGRAGGLTPGEYLVAVTATTIPEPGAAETIGELLTPEHYGDPQRSGLRFTVARGRNRIDLPLRTADAGP